MIAKRLQEIREQLPEGVRLVAVSKFHPVERMMEAYTAGQRLFGENRPQELATKVPLMPSDVEWHFIGHLQTNKLKFVLPYVSMVQSVDSFRLLDAVNDWCVARNRCIDILLEFHLGAEETKHGFSEEEILTVLGGAGVPSETPASRYAGVRFRGLMGMATNTDDETVIRADFARIKALFDRIRTKCPQLENFDELSIGMSGDWPLALEYGATLVRIGTAVFGEREY